jgi:hypothetical protein
MTKGERRNRIPTSDELEQQGALTPATGPPTEKRGGLLKFLRVGRFRVSDDVAARKHVGSAEPHPPAVARGGDNTRRAAAPVRPTTEASARRAESIVPRKIRIDPSVKERRGLGLPRDGKGPEN